MEELLARHRQEKKELQTRVQTIKRNVPKGDKKRDKEAKKQIAELEADIKERHARELTEFNIKEEEGKLSAGVAGLCATDDAEEHDAPPQQKKMSKAQRRRKKQETARREREEEIREAKKDFANSAKYKEKLAIIRQLAEIGSTIKEMKSDGNCLYHAFLDQAKIDDDLTATRLKVATYLRQNMDCFKLFLVDNNTGDCYDNKQYEEYCVKTEQDGTWGGQLELQALSKIYQCLIRVVQADTPDVVIGDEFSDSKPIVLAYHRHQLSLGEHYNSIKPINKNNDNS